MEYKQIQELIKTINKSNIGELSIEEKDFKITIKQKKENIQTFVNAQPIQSNFLPQAPQPTSLPQQGGAPAAPAEKKPAAADTSNLVAIKSPMIGTFYRRASPDKPLLAEVGQEVKPGQAVCIIEAMKLFNEIESEVSGTIVKVLVDDASPVEFDQPLFLVEPN
ncbi:acetyl-CoA carboxylase biotin carboxyl carrier protein [Arachidicoccus rhizosphaerae]|jgi:acetyl-CoA carboxylase biotin carboxyl carrier protein|uniref:Biotin carboxyl carrier protein of acetyl-CoA carboxylase n=1 Tax=Arachidicoccus rhizosphaerae TaxID=551991 RepID=A0A1H4B3G3_9BACT|nr:acetyl-CoA carboxylase biotin carboxyl carrier protein [Arachidicoccus rhizosphaerae]SEA42442.1 acetyl-CoA carboxylase biotin carboxyl carrier protein [Arachidicoccus rhizosphaerae]